MFQAPSNIRQGCMPNNPASIDTHPKGKLVACIPVIPGEPTIQIAIPARLLAAS